MEWRRRGTGSALLLSLAALQAQAAESTLMQTVVGMETARVRSVVDYCEAHHAPTSAAMRAAYDRYVADFRKVTIAFLETGAVDPDRPVPGDIRRLVASNAALCVDDARRYEPAAYCAALLDSFAQIDAAKMQPLIAGQFRLIDALAAANRLAPDGAVAASDPAICGPKPMDRHAIKRAKRGRR